MLRSVKRWLREQTGQALVGYALLLIVLALAALVALPAFGTVAQSSATQFSLALPWAGGVCPESPETGSQPEVALRHTRSADQGAFCTPCRSVQTTIDRQPGLNLGTVTAGAGAAPHGHRCGGG